MQVIHSHHYKSAVKRENFNSSGYICPFKNEDCAYLDSLSMTKTVNCNNCTNFNQEMLTGNHVKISVGVLKVHSIY